MRRKVTIKRTAQDKELFFTERWGDSLVKEWGLSNVVEDLEDINSAINSLDVEVEELERTKQLRLVSTKLNLVHISHRGMVLNPNKKTFVLDIPVTLKVFNNRYKMMQEMIAPPVIQMTEYQILKTFEEIEAAVEETMGCLHEEWINKSSKKRDDALDDAMSLAMSKISDFGSLKNMKDVDISVEKMVKELKKKLKVVVSEPNSDSLVIPELKPHLELNGSVIIYGVEGEEETHTRDMNVLGNNWHLSAEEEITRFFKRKFEEHF